MPLVDLLVTDGENDSGEGLLRQTNSASRPADNLAAAFTEIADELHLQYLLGFQAATADGKAHEIDVRVKRSGVVYRMIMRGQDCGRRVAATPRQARNAERGTLNVPYLHA